MGAGVAERVQQGVVHEGEGDPADEGLREPVVGRERRHQVERRVGDAARSLVVREVLCLVVVHEAREPVVRRGDVLDAHVPAEVEVVAGARLALLRRERSPAEVVDPALGHDDEGAEDVAQVVVADAVGAVHLVHTTEGGSPLAVGEAVLEDRVEQQHRVVVPLLGVARELAGAREQAADRRDGVGAEQRERQRLRDVPGELEGGGDPRDLEVVVVEVKAFDRPKPVPAVHEATVRSAA